MKGKEERYTHTHTQKKKRLNVPNTIQESAQAWSYLQDVCAHAGSEMVHVTQADALDDGEARLVENKVVLARHRVKQVPCWGTKQLGHVGVDAPNHLSKILCAAQDHHLFGPGIYFLQAACDQG